MKRTKFFAILFLLFLTVSFTFGTVLSQVELEESTLFSIEVHEDGSATWTIERRFLLETEEDVETFQQYLSEFEAQKEWYLEKFSNETNALVERASLVTHRNMRAENFAISIDLLETVSGSYGLLKYQFDWIGFARIEDKRIVVGDVFEGGLYLYRDDALAIRYPAGYMAKTVSPTPDEHKEADRVMTWYGRRNFGSGEPTVILQEKFPSFLSPYMTLIFSVLAIVAVASVGLWFFKVRKRKKVAPTPSWKAIEDDEDRVVALLKASGGVLYQSTIAKRCGFSRSKTSELIKSMEKRGIVNRKKKGREKLVTLTNKGI